jgi:hypothetical protein
LIAMNLIDLVKTLHSFGERCLSKEFDPDNSVIFKFNNRNKIKNELSAANIPFDVVGENQIAINILQFHGLFYDRPDFLKRCVGDNAIFNTDIGILFYQDDEYLYYNSESRRTSIGMIPSESNHFIQNIVYYLEFIRDFKQSDISSYHDDARREFVIVSAQKGKLQIGYPLIPPDISNEINMQENVGIFCERNKTQEFGLFLREQIIESLSKVDKEDRFPFLTCNIKNIIESSQRNYETYLNKFNFEELKKNFRKERDEYFSSIRDILSKILEKVVSIPISISAAALAIYNLKSEPNYAYIVIAAFIVYSLFDCYLLRLLQFDVSEIKIALDGDLEIIKKSSNIPGDILASEGSKVYRKIARLRSVIIGLQILFAILSCVALIVSFQFLSLPAGYSALCILLVVVFHAWITSTRTWYSQISLNS